MGSDHALLPIIWLAQITTKTCKVNYLWTEFKCQNTADIGEKEFSPLHSNDLLCIIQRQARQNGDYENKARSSNITEPDLGRANVITGHCGQTDLELLMLWATHVGYAKHSGRV